VGRAAMAGDTAAAARLAARARTAVDLVAAPVAGRTAADVLLRARQRRTGGGIGVATLARDAAATAGRRGRARAAVDLVSAPVASRTAGDVLRGARERLARTGVGSAALAGHGAAAAGLRRDAGSAVDLVAAAVTRRPARDALRGARLRLTPAAVGVTAVPEDAAAAASLGGDARPAVELIAASVAGRPACDALLPAGERGARRRGHARSQ